ncbi:hypothetical protein [Ancylobacter oerskovii]|uniref:Uncharacterized protein n=2 Tax=Ancylobacter oerskovii TaxID=459519 RepID=A0ABW4Z0X4_9HYPH
MLDIADEIVRFCSCNMPAEQYYRTANAIWVIAHRAAKNHETADELKAAMLERRAGRAALGEKEG